MEFIVYCFCLDQPCRFGWHSLQNSWQSYHPEKYFFILHLKSTDKHHQESQYKQFCVACPPSLHLILCHWRKGKSSWFFAALFTWGQFMVRFLSAELSYILIKKIHCRSILIHAWTSSVLKVCKLCMLTSFQIFGYEHSRCPLEHSSCQRSSGEGFQCASV